MHPIKELSKGLLHLFYPQLCEGCRAPLVGGEVVLCVQCLPLVPRTGFHHVADNDAAVRLAGRVPYEFVTAYAWFTDGGLLQHLLHGLKYRNRKAIGTFLGEALGEELAADTDWAKRVDVIVPIPLHPKKEAARGFNQSALVAEGIGAALGKPCYAHALRRNKHTESQTNKSRAERVANVSGVFSIANAEVLHNKHVLLVDDVLTTGATLEAAAMALLEQDGVRVSIAAVALAGTV